MASMEIKWLGHSCFRLEYGGYRVVLDPFAPGSVPGLRDIRETADLVLCSHQHHDHNYREGVALRKEGPGNPFAVTEFPAFHDDCQGAKRGPNTMFLLETDSLRVAHLGDIGAMPNPGALERLRGVDALMLPVGGYYTVGPQEAWAIAGAIQPRVILPMHYRSDRFGFEVLGTVEEFLELCGRWARYDTDTLELTGSMSRQTAVLTYSE